MSWYYDPTSLATNKLMQVRYLVGDTIANDPQVQDEEITFALSQRTSVYGAAAMVCRSLSTQLSRVADTVDKDLRTTLSAKATAYSRRARAYEVQAIARSGAMPYAGGISVSDKITRELDPDRVAPQFNLDMEDNYLPVAPVGNEGAPQPIDPSDTSDDNV